MLQRSRSVGVGIISGPSGRSRSGTTIGTTTTSMAASAAAAAAASVMAPAAANTTSAASYFEARGGGSEIRFTLSLTEEDRSRPGCLRYFVDVATSLHSWTVAKTGPQLVVLAKFLERAFPTLEAPAIAQYAGSSSGGGGIGGGGGLGGGGGGGAGAGADRIPAVHVSAFLRHLSEHDALLLCKAVNDFFETDDVRNPSTSSSSSSSNSRSAAAEQQQARAMPRLRREFRGELDFAVRCLRAVRPLETLVKANSK
jgi:hypothetical protein